MAVTTTKKVTTTNTGPATQFQKISKTKLFDDNIEAPVQKKRKVTTRTNYIPQPIIQQVSQPMTEQMVAPIDTSVVDPTLLLIMSLFNNNNNNCCNHSQPVQYPPTVMNSGSGNCPNYYPSLPNDIAEIKLKIEELKATALRQPIIDEKTGEVVYDDSGLVDLIKSNQEANWNKLLELEARLLEVQNEHYDIYNLINSNASSAGNEEYYEEEIYDEGVQDQTPQDEYEEYEEVTTTTTPVDGYDEEYETTTTEEYSDDYYDDGYDQEYGLAEDYYINKDNYKEFMKALKDDIKK